MTFKELLIKLQEDCSDVEVKSAVFTYDPFKLVVEFEDAEK